MKRYPKMNDAVAGIIDSYPEQAKTAFTAIRQLVFDVGRAEKLGDIEETLKWGEPAYLCRGGSTVRINWRSRNPDQISLYFNCQTPLISTFREIYPDAFGYIGNRELTLTVHDPLPKQALSHCLSMALRYHQLKHLPLLGA